MRSPSMPPMVNVSCCPVDVMYPKERLTRLGPSPASWRSARRFSASATVQSPTGPDSGQASSGQSTSNATKRRLSQVGAQVSAVVTRRLSTTIGWRNLGQWSSSVIATEAKGLCAQYIRARFRRSSIFHRKLGLQRLRSVVNMTASYGGSSETFQYLNILGKELEVRHPKVYRSVCRQICRTLTSEATVHEVFFAVATELIPREDAITVGRIVALFAIAGGLAVDCVQQGHVDYVLCLIESFGMFVEREMATWITQQGGWGFIVNRLRPNSNALSLYSATSIFIGIMCLILIFAYIPLCSLLNNC